MSLAAAAAGDKCRWLQQQQVTNVYLQQQQVTNVYLQQQQMGVAASSRCRMLLVPELNGRVRCDAAQHGTARRGDLFWCC
ncbi:hypothetical protein ACOMHN_011473 [Nucella lapillus]